MFALYIFIVLSYLEFIEATNDLLVRPTDCNRHRWPSRYALIVALCVITPPMPQASLVAYAKP
jgi:hypothetical protein